MSQAGANTDTNSGGTVTSVQTVNATPQFTAGPASTIDFALANLALGSSMPALTSGTSNVAYGSGALGLLVSANGNVAIGNSAASQLVSGGLNVAVGLNALTAATSTVSNIAIGAGSLAQLTTATGRNTVLGSGAIGALKTGNDNVGIGYLVGNNYTGAESSNILISNDGVAGESNVMRLGTQGSGPRQVSQTYIAGVLNTPSGMVVKTISPGAYPYTTLTTDFVILVDTSVARTINLIATPVTGTTYRIKDNVGTAATFNITITPAAGTIDGAASLVVNSNWGSVDVCYNGTSWRVL